MGILRNRLRSIKLFDWLKTKYYNITLGIQNIFRWMPIVWKDREWEYNFFTMQFIYHKLKYLQKRDYDKLFEGGEWSQRYLNLCIWLIEEEWRMEDYEDDLAKSLDPGKTVLGEFDKYGFAELNVVWDSPEAEQNYYKTSAQRDIRQKKIHNLIYKILATRGGYWWD